MKLYVSYLLLCLTMSGSALATTLVKEDDESILRRTQYIVTGTVERVDTLMEKDNKPFEYVSFKIARIYKNSAESPLLQDEKIVVRQIGGTVNGITLDVAGLTKFVKDSQMLLSVTKDEETGYYYVTGSVQGSYYMVDNTLINDTRASGLSFAKVSGNGQMALSSGEVKQMTLQQMEEKIRRVAAREAEMVEE